MGPKLDPKTLSFGGPSWHPFGGGCSPRALQSIFLEAQVAPPKPPPTKKKNRILVMILFLAANFFWEGGSQWGATWASKKLLCGALGLQDPFQMEANLSFQN